MSGRLNKMFLVASAAITMSCQGDRAVNPTPAPPGVPPEPSAVLSSVVVSPATLDLQDSEIAFLGVTARDQRGQWMDPLGRIEYSSTDISIATVSDQGRVTAIAPGTVTISATVTIRNSISTGSMTVTVRRASLSDSLILTGTDHGWQPEAGHVTAGGIVEWRTGRVDWQHVPFTTVYLLTENYGYAGDSVDVRSGSGTHKFEKSGTVRYCTNGCWDPPDFGVIYVH
jgi:hypothetical protein